MAGVHFTLEQMRTARRITRQARRDVPGTQVIAMFFAQPDRISDLWIDLSEVGRFVVSLEGWWRPPGGLEWRPPHPFDVHSRFRNE